MELKKYKKIGIN